MLFANLASFIGTQSLDREYEGRVSPQAGIDLHNAARRTVYSRSNPLRPTLLLLACALAGSATAQTFTATAALSGAWYDPARVGQWQPPPR